MQVDTQDSFTLIRMISHLISMYILIINYHLNYIYIYNTVTPSNSNTVDKHRKTKKTSRWVVMLKSENGRGIRFVPNHLFGSETICSDSCAVNEKFQLITSEDMHWAAWLARNAGPVVWCVMLVLLAPYAKKHFINLHHLKSEDGAPQLHSRL